MDKKKIVISGANIYYGGKLTIFKEFLRIFIKLHCYEKYEIVAFVYKKDLFAEFLQEITIVELSKERKSYFHRIYIEYFYYKKYSKHNDIECWISINDLSPIVVSERQYLYWHNVLEFYKMPLYMACYSPIEFLMTIGYKIFTKINLYSNDGIIVQQKWIKEKFIKKYKLQDNNIIINKPTVYENIAKEESFDIKEQYIFTYPVFPRSFKNIEVICEAVKLLLDLNKNFKVFLTMSGNENKYANKIYNRYKNVANIEWLGFVDKEKINEIYRISDCLIFSSYCESWGLPISEFKNYGKPMLLADKKYAKETLGRYDKAAFFNPADFKELSKLMLNSINGTIQYKNNKETAYEMPYYSNLEDLIKNIV